MSMLERFVNKFREEGVDHIRISPFAETRIGKITSREWRHTYFVPHMGEFTSPACFANWLCTGDDDARHNVNFRFNETVKGYLNYVLYGKFYQLCAMKSILVKESKYLHLPFVAYKQHVTGVKEFDRFKEYPSIIKDMIEHILDNSRGNKVQYNWDSFCENLEDRVQERVKTMVGDVVIKPPQPKKQKKPKDDSNPNDADPDSQLNFFPPAKDKVEEKHHEDDSQSKLFPPVKEEPFEEEVITQKEEQA